MNWRIHTRYDHGHLFYDIVLVTVDVYIYIIMYWRDGGFMNPHPAWSYSGKGFHAHIMTFTYVLTIIVTWRLLCDFDVIRYTNPHLSITVDIPTLMIFLT